MNTSVAVQQASVNWTVREDVDFAIPEPLTSEHATPLALGMQDAKEGNLCVPEMFFTQWGQMLEYVEGYESVAGETLLSKCIKNARKALRLTDADIAAKVEELQDGMADDDFNRFGCSYAL